MKAALAAALAVLLVGCGYRFSEAEVSNRTVSVPHVCGDVDGRLTNALVHHLTANGWRYRECAADLVLRVEVVCCNQNYIGYQLDRVRCQEGIDEPSIGTEVNRLLPNEGRYTVGAKVCLVERCSGKTVFGPTQVTAHLDYDFNPLITDTRLAVFSLGELVNIDEAQDIALEPLYERLSQKIVDLLANVCA